MWSIPVSVIPTGYHSGGTARYLRTRIEGDTSGTTSVFVYAGGHIHLLNSNLIYSISRESWGPWIGDGAQGTFECRKSWITATIGNNATLFANTAQGVAFTLCSVQSVTVANHPVQLIGARNSVFRPALGNLSQSKRGWRHSRWTARPGAVDACVILASTTVLTFPGVE